jgi:hypothetical protein
MVNTGAMTYNTNNSPKAFLPANGKPSKLTFTDDVEGSVTAEGPGGLAGGFAYAQFAWSARGNPNTIYQSFLYESPQYDPFGRRTRLTPAGVKAAYTNYLYDRNNVVQEQVSSGATAHVLYGLGMDERYARINATGVVSYFLTDAMGSTIALTDNNGVVQTTYNTGRSEPPMRAARPTTIPINSSDGSWIR